MKLAAAIVLHNPPSDWTSNVLTYIDHVEKLYIFDNTPQQEQTIPKKIEQKSIYLHNGKNEGIARRLNQATRIASSEGFEFLMTMDQDSFFESEHIRNYIDTISHDPKKEDIASFGIQIEKSKASEINGQDLLITSGSIVQVRAALEIGGFDENLFIDYVDTEFCFRSWKKGFKTKAIQGISMGHQLGTRKNVWTPAMKIQHRKFHSASRLYYITRNYLYTRNKYPEYREYLSLEIVMNEVKNGVLYNGHPFKSGFYAIKGIIDFLKGKMRE